MSTIKNDVINILKNILKPTQFIPLSEPNFIGNESKYVLDCIESGWVSSVGSYVDNFEKELANYTGAKYCILTSSGTTALHMAYILAGVESNDEVLTQSMSFVATVNPMSYIGAVPHFVDVEESTLGIDADKLRSYLNEISEIRDGICFNRETGRRIKALVPMHTFGNPSDITRLLEVCSDFNLDLIEDAAEALGSKSGGKHLGTLGKIGVLSFNGNKIMTTGGGGAILTNDETVAQRAKHLTTTAKVKHAYEFSHDQIGYNYRMPNLNAALGLAQLESMDAHLKGRRLIYEEYLEAFKDFEGVSIFSPENNSEANNWLTALILDEVDLELRNSIIEEASTNNMMLRPVWNLLHTLPMFKNSPRSDLSVSEDLSKRIINIPSSGNLRL